MVIVFVRIAGRRSGFGLIEVTVALTLVAIAALSIAASGAFSQRLLRRAELQEQAGRDGEMLIDSLAALHTTATGVRDDNRIHAEWTTSPSTILTVISAHDSAGMFTITLQSDLAPPIDTLPCPSC